ncbi:MAG: hypothetical protein ACO3U0_07610 [Ilumatobacteraceae bacterium]|jgi:hypothetical protein
MNTTVVTLAQTAISADGAKNVSLIVGIAIIVAFVIVALVAKAIIMKIISVVIIAAIGFGVWSQRDSIDDCVNAVRTAVDTGGEAAACTFFGVELDVPATVPN